MLGERGCRRCGIRRRPRRDCEIVDADHISRESAAPPGDPGRRLERIDCGRQLVSRPQESGPFRLRWQLTEQLDDSGCEFTLLGILGIVHDPTVLHGFGIIDRDVIEGADECLSVRSPVRRSGRRGYGYEA